MANELRTVEAAKIVGSTATHGLAYIAGGLAGMLNKCADEIINADKESVLGICRDRDTATMYRKGRVDGYNAITFDSSKVSDKPAEI